MLLRFVQYFSLLLFALLPIVAIVFLMASSPAPHYPPKFYQQPSKTQLNQSSTTMAEGVSVAIVDEAELNLLLQESIKILAMKKVYNLSAQLKNAHINTKLSFQLPYFDKRFINVSLKVAPSKNKLIVKQATVGDINLPKPLISYLTQKGITAFNKRTLAPVIENIRTQIIKADIGDGFAKLYYQVGNHQNQQVAYAPVTAVETYLAMLAEMHSLKPNANLTLADVLTEFISAVPAAPSTPLEHSYSAMIIALSLHAGDARLLQASNWIKLYPQVEKKLTFSIHKRVDLAEHFINSAANYYYAGEDIAALIGLYKELNDARVNDKFGLVDLIANHAGIRFAKLSSDAEGRKWLRKNIALISNNNLVPRPNDAEKASLQDIFLLGKAGLNAQAINDINQVMNASIQRSALYTAK